MEFNNVEGTNLHADVDGYSVFTVPDYAIMAHWTRLQEWRRGAVYFDVPGEFAPDSFTPAQARELAGALLRAADEADKVAHVGALDRLVVMLEAEHDADEFVDDPSLVNEIRGDAESVVRLVRDEVATFIRANIDMQGLDFPDAESVAVWLEKNR